MTNRFRIRCINKLPRNDPYNSITHVGGTGAQPWTLTVDEVISRIQSGKEAFYVERPEGNPVDVIVARSRSGKFYIKTASDNDEPNNLLSLPECPK